MPVLHAYSGKQQLQKLFQFGLFASAGSSACFFAWNQFMLQNRREREFSDTRCGLFLWLLWGLWKGGGREGEGGGRGKEGMLVGTKVLVEV